MPEKLSLQNLPELLAREAVLKAQFQALRQRNLTLNMSRGNPAPAQLDLVSELLMLPGAHDFSSEDGKDCRNYGGLEGIPEARRLFAAMLGLGSDNVIVAGNSSLCLMHDCVVFSLLHGTCDSPSPLCKDEIFFLCPVPGYDRHFAICQSYGIGMIPVPLNEEGPEIDQVEALVASDPRIKGMWCVPKYSNPTGILYSQGVITRLAAMRTAAPDFRLYWDNAYAVHHLTDDRAEIADIIGLSAEHGHPNRPFVFASTSKITMAGSGLAVLASSSSNLRWFVQRMSRQTIGPDKINQLRHVRFLRNPVSVHALMERHRNIIAPKFAKVLEIFDRTLGGTEVASWTRPKGGYFISLNVKEGCARRVVALADQIGIVLTPAGATFPLGHDPADSNIRIAPTYPDLDELAAAAEGVALCVQLAAIESIISERGKRAHVSTA